MITATPVRINLATLVPPTAAPVLQPTSTWTPTQGISAQLEALEMANVRQDPDTSAALLGVIRSGERYPVLGRYYQWYQFQFPTSPNGRGWVFGELVRIIGDSVNIPEIDPFAQPTLPPAVFGATLTAEIVTRTPGGILTATAQAVAPAVTMSGEIAAPGELLPTFTYPPGIVPIAPTPIPTRTILEAATPTPDGTDVRARAPQSQGIAPIVPIVVLAGLGLLGLGISSLRR
ncbi:MAG: SH3 domain-containing protein [Anaerolinea sp.]|nr:SH3 domain-containing protein [Anaerolinea sp.]